MKPNRCLRLALAAALLLLAWPAASHEHGGEGRQEMQQRWAARRTQAIGAAVAVAADEHGGLWQARMERGQLWVSRSTDGGRRFSAPTAVNTQPEAILADGQNRPQIAVRGGVVAVAWSQAAPKVFAGHVRFARSLDGGKTFSTVQTLNDNRDEIGHGFAALAMNTQGKIAVAWLDGRDRAAADKTGRAYQGGSVYYALSDDAGGRFAPNRRLSEHSCECCRIGIALGGDGVATALWRQVFDGKERDFALARLEPHSRVQRASQDHWAINACPHHGGDIAIDGEGGRHMVWFTGQPQQPGLYYRRSDGERLTPPRPFGDAAAQAGYPTVWAQGQAVHIAWREFDGQGYRLLRQSSADRGENWSAAQLLASSQGQTDLPMFVSGAQLPLLAWSSNADGLRLFDLSAQP